MSIPWYLDYEEFNDEYAEYLERFLDEGGLDTNE